MEITAHLWHVVSQWLLPYAGNGVWGVAASIFCMVLTMIWAVGLHKNLRQAEGRAGGFMVLPISITLVWTLIAVTVGLLSGLLQSTLLSFFGAVPILNLFPTLVAFLARVAHLFVVVFALIVAVKHILNHAGRYMSAVGHMLTRPLMTGHSNAHMILGALTVASIVNGPALNGATLYIPSVLSCMLGLYVLVFVRPKWSEISREVRKAHVVQYGDLPFGRVVRSAEDEQLLREAMEEVEAFLSGESLHDEIARKLAVKKRISAQLSATEKADPNLRDLEELPVGEELELAEEEASQDEARH